jgi:glutamate N-acetyltransferase/amino-acid N-acetyltransferase
MYSLIPSGNVTSPIGFLAGAVSAGIRKDKIPDLAILYSEVACTAAGVFTTNRIKSAPVRLSKMRIAKHKAQAVVVNSGCANACVGGQGMKDALEITNLTSLHLGIPSETVLIASTGVIGVPLPMEKIRAAIPKVKPSREGGHDFARAIMTTDTRTKEIAIEVKAVGSRFMIGGAAKGAGMIHPHLATMLCFITTDASVDADFLQSALQKSVDCSFNMISVDGDTSPSDCVLVLANGLAANEPINFNNGEVFQEALNQVCVYLAKSIIRDAEGATKVIEVVVKGAKDDAQARKAARTVASSTLVKAAVHGNDPNWGRIVAALGRSKVTLKEERLDISWNQVPVMRQGKAVRFDGEELRLILSKSDMALIEISLNVGAGKAVSWGCDLSEEYVTINSAYTT